MSAALIHREDQVGRLKIVSAAQIRRRDQVTGHNFYVCHTDSHSGLSQQIVKYVCCSNLQRGLSLQMENYACHSKERIELAD
jgi:hypothetical protein